MLNNNRRRLNHKRFQKLYALNMASNLKYSLLKRMLPTSNKFEVDSIYPKYLCSKPLTIKNMTKYHEFILMAASGSRLKVSVSR